MRVPPQTTGPEQSDLAAAQNSMRNSSVQESAVGENEQSSSAVTRKGKRTEDAGPSPFRPAKKARSGADDAPPAGTVGPEEIAAV